MKGKMFILLFAVICSFTACVKEELIDPSEGEDITITAALSAEAIQTKVTKAGEGESLLTDDEKILNKTLVIVFKSGDSGSCIGFAEGTGNSLSVKTKIGAVTMVAIANAEDALLQDLRNQKSTLTYSTLKAKLTQQLLTSSNNLIKVKVLNTTLKHEDNGKNFPIELIHLPARIEINMNITGDGQEIWKLELTGYEVTQLCTQSTLVLPEVYNSGSYSYNTNQNHTGKISSSSVSDSKLTFYSYEKETTQKPVKVTIKGTLVSVDSSGNTLETIPNKEYKFDLDPKVGGLSVTKGIVHGYAYIVTGNIDAKKPGISLVVKVVPLVKVPLDVDYGKDESWKD